MPILTRCYANLSGSIEANFVVYDSSQFFSSKLGQAYNVHCSEEWRCPRPGKKDKLVEPNIEQYAYNNMLLQKIQEKAPGLL